MNMIYTAVFGVVLPFKILAAQNFTRHNNPQDSSEHHTRRLENLKSHIKRST
jgi:hypothetical protein